MKKQSHYHSRDGRCYTVTMSWNEKFKDSAHVFAVKFAAVDRLNGRPYRFPPEIATYALGDPEETLGEKVEHYYEGSREQLMVDYLSSAYRRATDYLERGK